MKPLLGSIASSAQVSAAPAGRIRRSAVLRCAVGVLCSCAPALVLVFQVPSFGQAFEIVDLGNLGGFRSNAYDINDAEQIVGFAHNGSTIRPFRITPVAGQWFRDDDLDGANDLMLDLGVLDPANPPTRFGIARGINELGQVTGSAQNEVPQFRAFFWDGAGMVDLGSLGYPTQQNPARIGEDGKVVGTGYVDSQTFRGFQWDSVNGLVDLGALPGATRSSAADINGAGRIVGGAYTPGDADSQPATWSSSGGTLVAIGTFGGTLGTALGINESEQVVGFAADASGEARAFRLTPPSPGVFFQDGDFDGINDLLLDLGELDPGNLQTWALDIDENGNVVGFSASTTAFLDHRAFLWNGVEMIDLNAEIAAGSGWILLEAKAINDLGQIVGVGRVDSEERAFLLKPARRWFVRQGASGANTGRTWGDAFVDLQSALTAASAGEQIWVAQGTYEPTAGLDRTKSFVLEPGVALYGGFAGGEILLEQRDPSSYPAVLSGDLAGDDAPSFANRSDNSIRVVTCSSGNATTRLDGFVIRGGKGGNGGGVYVSGSSPAIVGCTITDNEGAYGGGLFLATGSPRLVATGITDNRATTNGGGIYASRPLFLVDCSIARNTALGNYGGGIYASMGLTLDSCAVTDNTSGGVGGGLYQASSSAVVVFLDSTLAENGAVNDGGGAYVRGRLACTGCSFVDNQGRLGGGLYLRGECDLAFSSFIGNVGTSGGGGLYSYGNYSTGVPARVIRGCRFVGNSAATGGGLRAEGAPSIADCLFQGNVAAGNGGGAEIHLHSSAPVLANSTFEGNSAGQRGGGVSGLHGTPGIANSVLWANSATLGSLQVQSMTVSRSNVQDGYAGAGNLASDPLFVSAATGDLRLAAGSPCIDSGSNAAAPTGDLLDLDGRERFFDDPSTPDTGLGTAPLVDRGAHEFGSPAGCASDCDGDGVCDADEIAGGSADIDGDGVPDECAGGVSDVDLDQAETAVLLPGGSADPLLDPVVVITNVAGPNDASVTAVESSAIIPGAGGYSVPGKSLVLETSLADGEFFLQVSLPFTPADLGGMSWTQLDLTHFDQATIDWELAVSANTQPSPGHAGPIGDRTQSSTSPAMSGELGDYGVYWNAASQRGFVWANVDHTTVFAIGLAFEVLVDCDGNGQADEQDIDLGVALDCDGNGIPDVCDIALGLLPDCNGNGIPDACDVDGGASADAWPEGGDGVPDECQDVHPTVRRVNGPPRPR